MGLENIKNRIAKITESLGSLPEGSEKELALFEKKCLNDIIEAADFVTESDTAKKEKALGQTGFAYAALSYIDESRKSGNAVTVDEITKKAEIVSKNDVFRKITLHLFNNSLGDHHELFDRIPGEAKGEHFSEWVKELDNGTSPDYSAKFDELAKGKKLADNEKLKERYLELSSFNERIKGVDRTFAKTPEYLFDLLTSDEEIAKQTQAAEAASFFDDQKNAVDTLMNIAPKSGSTDGAPQCFVRQYFLFLDRNASEDAMKANREKVDRFCSSDPENTDFKREFVRESINKLLAVKDEDLAVTTKEKKLEVYKKYGMLIDALFDAESNMLNNFNKDFYVPKRVKEVLKHKADLVTANIISVKKELENDLDPHYAEARMLDGMNSDDLRLLLEVPKNGYGGTDYPDMTVLNQLTVATQLEAEEAQNANSKVLPDPEKYDGVVLEPDDIATVTKPAEPAKPGFFGTIASGLLTVYNVTLGRLFGRVETPSEKYAKKAATYERLVQERERGISLEEDEKSAVITDIAKEYSKELNNGFSGLEKRSNSFLNRLDHITIGHKTLRAHLEAEFRMNNPTDIEDEIYYSNCAHFVNSSLKNGHAEELIIGAQLAGKPVRIYNPDPVTGILGNPPYTDKKLPEDKPIPQCRKADELKTLFERINTPADAAGRLSMAADCMEGVLELNYFGRTTLARQNSNNLLKQFFPDSLNAEKLNNPHKFSITRTAIESHVFAYLLTEKKMTPEQIADTNYLPKEKRDAGEYIKGIMTSENGDLDSLAKYNVNGIVKMKEYINEKLKGTNITDPKQLYSESNKYIFPLSHFIVDLDQEQKFMKSSVDKAFANVFESQGKDAAKKWDDGIRSNTVFSGMDDEMLYLARFRTGCVSNAATQKALIIQQEIFKKAFSEKMAEGKPVLDALDENDLNFVTASVFSATNLKRSDASNKGIEEFRTATSVKTPAQIFRFAKFVTGGGIVKGGEAKDGGFSYSSSPEAKGAEKSNDAEVKVKEEFVLKK